MKRDFWSLVEPQPDGCWHWRGAAGKSGYGCYAGRAAHRVAYELRKGPIPDKMLVCHKCDVPRCVNPDHLFVGTNRDNMQDAANKGRTLHGAKSPNAKLTAEKACQIVERHAAGESLKALSRAFGLDRNNVRNIVRGISWYRETAVVRARVERAARAAAKAARTASLSPRLAVNDAVPVVAIKDAS
jgi:hypothetical protein